MAGADLEALVARILERPGPVRLVAVDGPGGAGKTTFAARLAEAAGAAPVVHTDDFASDEEPIDWWPRLLHEVIEPLGRGEPARVEPAPIVLIEGVTSGRAEWAEQLAFTIWVETPAAVRRRRVADRDGPIDPGEWATGSAAEAAHYRRDPVRERADVVIDGQTGAAADLDIAEVAEQTGLAPSALRYYERLGLLEPAGRNGLRRTYAPDAVDRLALIINARATGFSLAEVKALVDADDAVVRQTLVAKAAEIEERIAVMQAQQHQLAHALTCEHASILDCPTFRAGLRHALPARPRSGR